MRGAPRAASASRSEPRLSRTSARAGAVGHGLARSQRLRAPDEFAALAGDRAPWRQGRQWITVAARLGPSLGMVADPADAATEGQIRFGFTVGRRQARRAVQRVMVKRIMREAARMACPLLSEKARGRRVDVVLRLRSALPEPEKMTLATVKLALRGEADALMARLASFLDGAAR